MPDPVITDVRFEDADWRRWVHATFDDSRSERLFGFFADEISLSREELVGKTEAQARSVYFERDRAYLRS